MSGHDQYAKYLGKEGVHREVVEDCSRLLIALANYQRGGVKRRKLFDDLADLFNTLETLIALEDPKSEEWPEIYKRSLRTFDLIVKEKVRMRKAGKELDEKHSKKDKEEVKPKESEDMDFLD